MQTRGSLLAPLQTFSYLLRPFQTPSHLFRVPPKKIEVKFGSTHRTLWTHIQVRHFSPRTPNKQCVCLRSSQITRSRNAPNTQTFGSRSEISCHGFTFSKSRDACQRPRRLWRMFCVCVGHRTRILVFASQSQVVVAPKHHGLHVGNRTARRRMRRWTHGIRL